MELSWLMTFLTAAEIGNFRKTAEVLYISQPSVTVHIKLLEKELGVRLFVREGRKVILTEEGKRYAKHAQSVIDVYKSGLEDLQSFSQGYNAKLTIAISPLIADTILPYVLKKYMKEYPMIEIDVRVIESVHVEEAIMKEEVDIGLSCLPSKFNNLKSHPLYQDHIVLVCAHDGKDSEMAESFDVADILSTNHLFTHNHPGYWDSLCRFISLKYPKTKMMKVSQVHITKRFIIEGLGVSFLPQSTVRRELLEGSLLEVYPTEIPLPDVNMYAVYQRDSELLKGFLQYISGYRI